MSADFCFPLPHLLALPTEAWLGAEIHRHLAENIYVNLPGPLKWLHVSSIWLALNQKVENLAQNKFRLSPGIGAEFVKL